jgi:DNA-3-methyladenine glycosylase
VSATRRAARLPVSFFDRPADAVARDLLGTVVVSRVGGVRTAGVIVETEAYLGYDDPASHGFLHRRNERNAAMFGPPGLWYVYLSYGMHWCANLVCESEGRASAVLLRALAPVGGLETMRRRRGGVDDRLLCAGPGRLCQALGITRSLDGASMSRSPVAVTEPEPGADRPAIACTPRIGITKAADWPLRFVVEDSPYLSKWIPNSRKPLDR